MSDSQAAVRSIRYPSAARDVLHRIARDLRDGVIPQGDRASLRRMAPGSVDSPAFWRIAVKYLEPARLLASANSQELTIQETQWATLLSAMAAIPASSSRPLGDALAETSITEARVLRLLRASGLVLLDVTRTIAHHLAATGVAFEWNDLAELLLTDARPEGTAVRRRIAYDYYRHQRAGLTPKDQEVSG